MEDKNIVQHGHMSLLISVISASIAWIDAHGIDLGVKIFSGVVAAGAGFMAIRYYRYNTKKFKDDIDKKVYDNDNQGKRNSQIKFSEDVTFWAILLIVIILLLSLLSCSASKIFAKVIGTIDCDIDRQHNSAQKFQMRNTITYQETTN